MDKVPRKKAPIKAKVAKVVKVETKVVLPVKKVATKKVLKKPVVAKAQTKLKIAKKLAIKKASQTNDEVKLIPGAISFRLAEKRKLYERVYRDYTPKIMRPVAIASGYAYISVGIFLALLMTNSMVLNTVSNTASVLCFAGGCEVATTTEAVSTETLKPVEFMPLPPVVPGIDTNLRLQKNLDTPVKVLLLPIDGGAVLTITGVAESDSNIVHFLLPTASLSNGKYLVQAELYDENTKQTRVKVVGPTISVENIIAETEVILPTENDESGDLVSEEKDIEDGEVLGVSTSTDEEMLAMSTTIVDKEPLLEPEEVAMVEVSPAQKNNSFTLSVTTGTTANQSIIKILPTFTFEKVELSLKLKGGGETFFLGNATKAEENWFYWLDHTAIPTGVYNLIVRGFDNGTAKEETVFILSNKTRQDLTEQSVLDQIQTQVNSYFGTSTAKSDLAKIRTAYATSYLDNIENDYPVEYLSDYLPELDRLFTNYAGAVAGKNNALVILADNQLVKYLDVILVASEGDSSVDEGFAQELSALLIDVKKYIRLNEEEFTSVTSGASAIDADQDGLTDYDEVSVFSTDPNWADTDNDGIIDPIEIISGYSPLNTELEAVSRLTNSLEDGVINGDLLAITSVDPFYLYAEPASSPKILTSVSGNGIPNSFARLYVDDMPEFVIVKVGPTGTFTQTIDKDFVTVNGEVVLAVTDNTGKIIMRGQPLQLGKMVTNKQLFNSTAIDAAVIKSVDEFKISNTVGALGVVSFGLILLLLGKALVPRKEPVSLEIA